jgi:tetratricopeptide (TPR) repeat protein
MQREGAAECGYRRQRRTHRSAIALVAVFVFAAFFAGCKSSNPGEQAAKSYQDIRNDFLHGNLDVARVKAQQAGDKFSALGPDWSMKFRLLEAEILTYQGRRPDVLALLTNERVSYPATGDDAIERKLLCSQADLGLGKVERADRELQEARTLSDASNSRLAGEVLRAEAKMQYSRDHPDDAVELYRKSIAVARRNGDAFLEASDLLNLGWLELHLEHYDEAAVSLKSAADFAKPIQARTVIEAAHGNLGVVYFHLGDYEKALSNFLQAEQEAK